MALSNGTKAFLVVMAGLLAVGAIVVGGGLWWIDQQVGGLPGEGEPVTLEIEQGTSGAAIADQLAQEEVIRNALAFRIVARTRGVGGSFAAGTYELETGMSVDEALEALGAGPVQPDTIRITIAEGLTVTQTLARMADQSPYTVEEYRQVLDAARQDRQAGPLRLPEWVPPSSEFAPELELFEGLLFPQTYEFEEDASAAAILQRLLDETEVAMASVSPSAIQEAEAAGVSKYEGLIIASLIEREARVPGEWRDIGSVIRNRIAEEMLLQIDATLLYAAGDPDGGPSSIDTEVESPYNTYANAGLPPTPISGARVEAIQAAFDPADTPYRYYVVSPECDGSHQFAETLEEHNANVQEYRDAGRCA